MSGRCLVVVLAVFPLLFVACGGGSSSSDSETGPRLGVLSFSHDGRSDTCRDRLLRIEFTNDLRRESISPGAVGVTSGPNLRTPVPGALILGGDHGTPDGPDVLWFDPTRSQALLDRFPKRRPLNEIPMDLAFGFEAHAAHRIVVASSFSGDHLEDRAKRPILAGWSGEFKTGGDYVHESVPPEFIGADGMGELAFSPELAEDGLVEYDAHVRIEFSEAIHPNSMEPGGTVHVVNLDVLDHLGRPIPIPGTLSPSNDGRVWTFRPSFHYGTGPWNIEVRLTTDIHDRAGNALVRPVTRTFVTRENPDVDTVHSLVEDFDTNDQEDVVATTAEWNSTTEGELTGGAITTTVVTIAYAPITGTSNKLLTDFPLVSSTANSACPTAWKNGCRVMMSYPASDIGVAGAITEIYWGPASNALFAATHDNVKIRVGHGKNSASALSKKFDQNWASGQTPVAAYDGSYKIPQDADVNTPPGTITGVANHWSWPKLATPFEYDGASALILDFAVDAAADCQTMRVWFHGTGPMGPGYPGIRLLVGDGKTATTHFSQDVNYPDGYPMVPDLGLVLRRRRTEARSRFYDSAQPHPDWAEPVLSPATQPGGAQYGLQWQGAPGRPHPTWPGMMIPDETHATAWSSDIDVADGYRFVRFRMTLIANLNSETVPHLRRIEMPYSFGKE